MHAIILAFALFTPGDPLTTQISRYNAVYTSWSTTPPPAGDETTVAPARYGYWRLAGLNLELASHHISRWLAAAPVYQPFGWPGAGGIFQGPDYLDGLLSKAETYFAYSTMTNPP